MSSEEFALRTVGSSSTWNQRKNHPETFRWAEIRRIFRVLAFTREQKDALYQALENIKVSD